MRAFLATGILGSFAFDSKGKVIENRLFPKKPEVIAERLETPSLLPEEEEILQSLIRLGYKEVLTDRKIQFPGISIVHQEDNLGKKALQEGFRQLALSLKWVSTQAELNELLSEVQVLRTKKKLRVERRDRIIIHAIGLLDELDKGLNAFSERVREWYGLHFPELARQIPSAEKFAEAVAGGGSREKIKGFETLAAASAGMDFSKEDTKELQSFCKALFELYQQKKSLAAYLENLCREVIPNISAIAGELLGARLLSQASGLEKLSRLPSSTVQLLGAEKALFRHLKGEGKAPKFGLLFAHPLVQNAPKEKRGKMARLIAAKISLASRIDFYTRENRGESLKKQLEQQAARIL